MNNIHSLLKRLFRKHKSFIIISSVNTEWEGNKRAMYHILIRRKGDAASLTVVSKIYGRLCVLPPSFVTIKSRKMLIKFFVIFILGKPF